MAETIFAVIYVILSYFLGSICTAVVVCKMFELPDPRDQGSKNPGATNVLRIAGKSTALMVLVGDMLKGVIPVLLARVYGVSDIFLGFVCFSAIAGHMFPVFFGFKGGKGVATMLGTLFGLNFMLGVLALATWIIIATVFRYSSLASLLTALVMPIYAILFMRDVNVFIPLMVVTFLIFYKHRDNITRLTDGTETKINLKKKNTLQEELASIEPEDTELPKDKKPE